MYELGQREIDAVAKVIRDGQLFRYRGGEGGWCDRFEAAFAGKIGSKYALALSSGTAGLICGMVGAGVKPGDEVIVPAYTFMATPLAVLAVGAIPVIVDVDESMALCPKATEAAISQYTRAIIPVHMIGRPCDMNAMKRIARKHKLLIIEDACQAVGGSYRGKRLGSIGDAGAFSFNQFKIIGAGEGGAMVTNDLTAYDKAMVHHDGGCVFRKHADKVSTPFFAGSAFRISEITGAILFEQLKQLDGILKRLRSRANAMRAELAKCSDFELSPCNDVEGDCGVAVSLTFDTIDAADAFMARHNETAPFWPYKPVDTGRHVYTHWTPILEQHGAFCAEADPFKHARRRIRYSAEMCSKSLEIMSRSVVLHTPYDLSVKDTRQAVKTMLSK
jgi:dTDP-4-amino-4,6-dideoxygalactose transaminase